MSGTPKGKITIDRELCKGCKYCIEACPKVCIVLDTQFNRVGYFPAHFSYPDRCTGCAMCAQMCPEMAIGVEREEKE